MEEMATEVDTYPKDLGRKQPSCAKLGTEQNIKTYKQIHKVGRRKANERIVSYNDTYPFYNSVIQAYIGSPSSTYNSSTQQRNTELQCKLSSLHEQMGQKRKAPREASGMNQQKRTKTDSKSSPVFRLKREASLNAQARVNIFFEKVPSPPKKPKPSESMSAKNGIEVQMMKTPELQVKLTDLRNSSMKGIASSEIYTHLMIQKHETKKTTCAKKDSQAKSECHRKEMKNVWSASHSDSSHYPKMCRKSVQRNRKVRKPEKNGRKCKNKESNIKKEGKKQKSSKVSSTPNQPVFKHLQTIGVERNLTVRRMASLNAEAIMAANRDKKSTKEHAARVDRYCVSWKHRDMKGKLNCGPRWVEGTGSPCCNQFEEEYASKTIQELSQPLPQQPRAKHLLQSCSEAGNVSCTIVSGSSHHRPEIHNDDRPSSVVDVVSAYPSNVSTPASMPIGPHCVGPILKGCLKPCTQYPCHASSGPEEFVTTSQFHTYTLGGIGSLSSLQMMSYNQPYRSAFSVPYNLAVGPYGYYSVNGFYQPAPGPILSRNLHAEPCLVQHVPMQVPQAQVKVLIHNPDTSYNCSAFSPQDALHLQNNRKPSSATTSVYSQGTWMTTESGNPDSQSGSGGNKMKCDSMKSENKGCLDGNGDMNREKQADRSGQKSKSKARKVDSSGPKQQHGKKADRKSKQVNEQGKKCLTREKKIVKKSTVPEPVKPSHGWSWEGQPTLYKVPKMSEDAVSERMCYPAVRHKSGDVVRPRDCVLLMSTSRKDKPYVAKVVALWEDPKDGEMMMSLMWYYRPEHTETDWEVGQLDDELFACMHVDENPVACIDDIAHVLTFSEYCRYKAEQYRDDVLGLPRQQIVPLPEEEYYRKDRLPSMDANPATVFFSRYVYDLKRKKIRKPVARKFVENKSNGMKA